MGLHERMTGAERVAKRRAALRAQGYKPRQFWLPDLTNAKVRAELAREAKHIRRLDAASDGRAVGRGHGAGGSGDAAGAGVCEVRVWDGLLLAHHWVTGSRADFIRNLAQSLGAIGNYRRLFSRARTCW